MQDRFRTVHVRKKGYGLTSESFFYMSVIAGFHQWFYAWTAMVYPGYLVAGLSGYSSMPSIFSVICSMPL